MEAIATVKVALSGDSQLICADSKDHTQSPFHCEEKTQ